MSPNRRHRTMSRSEQEAAGAAARGRGSDDYARRRAEAEALGQDAAAHGRLRRDAGSPSSQFVRQQAERRRALEARHAARGRGQEGAAPISQREASDVERYQQMRQQRSGRGSGRKPGGKLALKVVGGLLAAALVFVVGFVLVVSARMNSNVDASTRAALVPAVPGQPFYMLLVGSDRSAEREATNATGGTYRTDSIILARVDPIGAKLTLVSIQRDTLVDLGENGKQKINAAYTIGGPALLIKAVSDLAGVSISHYAEIDFDSFTSVVDAIGGITVNVPMNLDDDLAGLHIAAGEQQIDGATALALCRARHAYDKYGSGDYYRTANQRMVLGAILRKALSGNPASLLATIDSASNSVTTDLNGLDLMLLGIRFVGFDMSKNLMSGLEPTTSKYVNGGWYELLDTTAWQAMMSRVDRGLSPYSDASQDPTAGVAGITN